MVRGLGESAAIALAEELAADALLIDDRDGRREAEKRRLVVLGTLRVLADAAEHGLVDLQVALDRLMQTNFAQTSNSVSGFLLSTHDVGIADMAGTRTQRSTSCCPVSKYRR